VRTERHFWRRHEVSYSVPCPMRAADSRFPIWDMQLKNVIGATELEELPTLGRDAVQLQKTAPGVVESNYREGTFSSSTLDPQFSRNSGAIVDEALKSGTNQFHGNGFEIYRDTFLNNGNYFSATRPGFHQNVFGGTLGGPILRNRAFLFVADQGLGNRTTQFHFPAACRGQTAIAPPEQNGASATCR
jgi:hypothetical protein